MKLGKVIFLNGPSSSGKTTLAQLLQEKLPKPFMLIGIDKLIEMMPAHLNNWEGGLAKEGFSWKQETDEHGHILQEIQLGPYAQKVADALKPVVLALLDQGLNVLVDEVCLESAPYLAWQKALKPYEVLYVGIHASVDVLEQREKARMDRMQGSARAQHAKVHQDKKYDLLIDTSTHELEACANEILAALPYF